MLCARCRSLELPVRWKVYRGERGEGGDPFDGIVCQRCGGLLPVVPGSDAMLDGLARLARFGLAAGGHPIVLRRSS